MTTKLRSFFASKKGQKGSNPSIIKFGLIIAILMGLFYAWIIFDPFPGFSISRFFHHTQEWTAQVSGAILNFLGFNTTVHKDTITSPEFSVNLRHGCDAMEPTALFVFAVLAFPVPFRKKIPGAVIGALFLSVVNTIRVMTLFLTGVYYPDLFQTMHVDIWQALFIFLAMVFWVLWALWATKKTKRQTAGKPGS